MSYIQEHHVIKIMWENPIIKNKWVGWIIVCLVVCLNACHHRTARIVLEQAEILMNTRPDSVQLLLESIPQPEQLSKEEYATWCLLVTQARDKNYIVHTSDSIINVAVQYFAEQNEPQLYSKALYYKGRICQDLGEMEKAMEFFVEALDVGEQSNDYQQLFLIASRLGTLYGYQDLVQQTLESYCKAYNYAVLSGDSSSLSYASSYLGRAYGMRQDWEKAIDAYRRGEEIATLIQDEGALTLALGECADIYVRIGLFDKARINYNRIYQMQDESVKGRTMYYLQLGDLFRLTNQTDSAVFYLQQALQYDNIYTRQSVYQCFYYLYEEQKTYQEAIRYNNLYWAVTDSINQIANQEAIAEMSAKYKYERLENVNNRLLLENERESRKVEFTLFGSIFLIFLFVMVYQRQLLKKDHMLSAMRNVLDTQLLEFQKNKEALIFNRNRIDYLSIQLAEKERQLENTIYLKQEKEVLLTENECLKQKNMKLIEQMQKNIIRLNQQGSEYTAYKKMIESKIEHHPNILVRLNKEKWILQPMDWEELYVMLNTFSQNFLKRLKSSYSQMTETDCHIACLIRLGYTQTDLAKLLGVEEETVKKSKQRLRMRIDKHKKWYRGELESFLRSF